MCCHTIPILMRGSTWTISLTPGVRRSAAPMMVVMASWIDSREYTFLMNPEVSHYVILMPAQLFNRSIKCYQISELPSHLCNWSIKRWLFNTEPVHLTSSIMQSVNQVLPAYRAWSSCRPTNFAIDPSSATSLLSLIILVAPFCDQSIKCYQLTKSYHLAGPILQLINQAQQAYRDWPSWQPHYAIDKSSATSWTSLIILPAPLCYRSIKCYQLTKPNHLTGPIIQSINQVLPTYWVWSSCRPHYAIHISIKHY